MNMKYMLALYVCIPGCLAKCETEHCMLQIIHCEQTMKRCKREGRAQAECVPERVKEGTGVCLGGCLYSSHKVWLQNHTAVPKLDLNQPAWELRVMQVQLSED